jgi:radical SAM protein with 4Fe4S-binding SPASM domain
MKKTIDRNHYNLPTMTQSEEYIEYSPFKLLLHGNKSTNIISVLNRNISYDDSFPTSVELHLTDRCNLKCEWCIDYDIRRNNAEQDFSSLKRLVDELAQHKTGITIEGGGEPTTYGKFNRFVEYSHAQGVDLGLITNGVQKLPNDIVSCFTWIRVSIDSSNREEYKIEKGRDCFKVVMQNLAELNKNNDCKLLGVGYVLNKRNYQNLLEFIGIVEAIGINYIQIRPVEEHGELSMNQSLIMELRNEVLTKYNSSDLTIFFNARENLASHNNGLPCVAHSLSSIIHSNGDVMLCEKRRHDPVILGNINHETFHSIWNSKKRVAATKKLLDPKNQIGCEICRVTKYNQIFNSITSISTRNFI